MNRLNLPFRGARHRTYATLGWFLGGDVVGVTRRGVQLRRASKPNAYEEMMMKMMMFKKCVECEIIEIVGNLRAI